MLQCMDKNHIVLLSNEQIIKCCLAVDYWMKVIVLRSTCRLRFSGGLGIVTAFIFLVSSILSCTYMYVRISQSLLHLLSPSSSVDSQLANSIAFLAGDYLHPSFPGMGALGWMSIAVSSSSSFSLSIFSSSVFLHKLYLWEPSESLLEPSCIIQVLNEVWYIHALGQDVLDQQSCQ